MKRHLLLYIFLLITPLSYVHSQDDDLDNVGESTENFDDLEKELDNADKADLEIENEEVSQEIEAENKEKPADPKAEPEKGLEEELADEPVPEPPVAEEQPVPEPPVAEEKKEEAPPAPEPVPLEAPEQQEIVAPEPDPEVIPEEPPVAVIEDKPDLEFEERMGRIYKQFYSGKISDAEWFQIIGTKASEKYTVQNGDTMWGMSTTFFGNGFFWPKLWQLNSDYTNPHVLEPGQIIGFYPGTVAQEPVVNLAEKKYAFNEPETPRPAVTPEQAKAYMANAQIPPPLSYRPVLKKIPKSIPNWSQDQRRYDDTGFSLSSQKRFHIRDTTLVPSYITDVRSSRRRAWSVRTLSPWSSISSRRRRR